MADPNEPVPSAHDLAERLEIAERATGHVFADRELLRQALTHPSAVDERDPSAYYERLEFLGDAILGFLIADDVYTRFPQMAEGGMTRIKISLVSGGTLAAVAGELGLADALILGDSERGTGGRGMASALENVYEALTAALYLDAGMDVAREWVLRTLGPLIAEDAANQPDNPKSLLQELLQARGSIPRYRIAGEQGPPHDRTFFAEVTVEGELRGAGSGRSKKEAEMAAAATALAELQSQGETPA
ncbi:MAG: ribonuclease III [Coriobacteriales bacterium]|nr:ribonuclease III [Coriobacteriales bacterium]